MQGDMRFYQASTIYFHLFSKNNIVIISELIGCLEKSLEKDL